MSGDDGWKYSPLSVALARVGAHERIVGRAIANALAPFFDWLVRILVSRR